MSAEKCQELKEALWKLIVEDPNNGNNLLTALQSEIVDTTSTSPYHNALIHLRSELRSLLIDAQRPSNKE